MNEMMRALLLLGQFEVTSINTVADMTLYIGIEGDKAAYVVVGVDEDLDPCMEKVICSPAIARAVLMMFISGLSGREEADCYAVIGQCLPKLLCLRPIP